MLFSHLGMLVKERHSKLQSFVIPYSWNPNVPSSSASFPTLMVGSMFLMRRLHLARSCASYPDNSVSDKSFLMLSNHLRFGLLLLLFHGTSIAITLLPTYSSSQYMPTPTSIYFPALSLEHTNNRIIDSREHASSLLISLTCYIMMLSSLWHINEFVRQVTTKRVLSHLI